MSSNKVTSRNADTLDGYHANATPSANQIPVLGSDSLLPAGLLLKSKIIYRTRDLTAATGDVAYTGVGFTPTSVLCLATVDGGANTMVIGVSDSSLNEYKIGRFSNGFNYIENNFMLIETTSNNYQVAVVKTYDADGFTLTWTKTNSPTGTLKMIFLCFR